MYVLLHHCHHCRCLWLKQDLIIADRLHPFPLLVKNLQLLMLLHQGDRLLHPHFHLQLVVLMIVHELLALELHLLPQHHRQVLFKENLQLHPTPTSPIDRKEIPCTTTSTTTKSSWSRTTSTAPELKDLKCSSTTSSIIGKGKRQHGWIS
jgi:hypothetical protein